MATMQQARQATFGFLKSACRTRGKEEILGNVVSGVAPQKQVIVIRYKIGAQGKDQEWAGDGEDDSISRVSFFDTQCAAVYLTEKTDVAFRPFGLDLFDKLVKACKEVRSRLESEQRALGSGAIKIFEPQEGTAVAKLLARLSSLIKAKDVQDLTHLPPKEKSRLALLEKSILDFQANDPETLARQLTLRAGRVRTLVGHLKNVEEALSEDAVSSVFEARQEVTRKNEEAQRLQVATFPNGLLAGTGAESFSHMWESARRFSVELAYPGQSFHVRGRWLVLRTLPAKSRSHCHRQVPKVRGIRYIDNGTGTPGCQR